MKINIKKEGHWWSWEETCDRCGELIVLVYPSIELEDKWIDKLVKKYFSPALNKGYEALARVCKDSYFKTVKELQESCIEYKIELQDINYDLESLLISLKNEVERYY